MTAYLGFHQNTIDRWMKLYGFPRAQREKLRRGRLVWDKGAVTAWLEANPEIVTRFTERSNIRSGKR